MTDAERLLFDGAIVLALILLNGFLALSELALVSSRISRLRAMAEAGSSGARTAVALASDPGNFLSAVQVGITVIGLIAGAFSGSTIAEPLALRLEAAGIADTISDALAFIPVVTLVTYLSVVVGELVPKQLALRHPERMAAMVAPAMLLLTRIAWPLVKLLQSSSHGLLNLMGVKPDTSVRVSREEVRALIAEAERAGVVPPRAKAMMSGVIRLSERKVSAIMVPRVEVEWIDVFASPETLRARLREIRHSRVLAARGGLDDVLGVVNTKDVLDALLDGQPLDAKALVAEIPAVLDGVDALRAFETLRSSSARMLLVVDEYGTFQGVVTTMTLLEAVVGAFPAAGNGSSGATRRPDGSWLLDGDLPVDEMGETLEVPLETARHYQTVAGFVLAMTQQIPKTGDTFIYRGWRFEIVDLDGQRVDKILASPLPADA